MCIANEGMYCYSFLGTLEFHKCIMHVALLQLSSVFHTYLIFRRVHAAKQFCGKLTSDMRSPDAVQVAGTYISATLCTGRTVYGMWTLRREVMDLPGDMGRAVARGLSRA